MPKKFLVDDHVKQWGLIKLIHIVVFFVLNYVHCLLQVISFVVLLFNNEFATNRLLVLLYGFVGVHFMR